MRMLALLIVLLGLVSARSHAQETGPRMSGMLKAGDVELYHEVWGDGPPLVLIPGLGASLWLWEEQLPALSAHFTTIAFDNRGGGRSEAPAGPYTIAQMADDVAAMLDALGIERAHVLGFSMGGFVAQEFALLHPHRVDRLVLAATSAGGATHVAMSAETAARFLAAGGDARDWIRNRLPLAYTDAYLADGSRVERMIDARLAHPQPAHGYQAQLAAAAVFDRAEDVQRIGVRTLVLAASGDLLVPEANARYLAERIPGGRLIVYRGLGHQFNVEGHPCFNRDVIAFLTAPE